MFKYVLNYLFLTYEKSYCISTLFPCVRFRRTRTYSAALLQ